MHGAVVEFSKREKGVGLITFNRPEVMNALTAEMLKILGSILDKVKEDPSIHVLVLTGAGDKAFIAGADIREMKGKSRKEGMAFAKLGQDVFSKLEKLPQPVIAAVNGYALGGGSEIVLACDIVYATKEAKFGQPEVKLGIIPGFGGTQRLSRLIGKMRAKELIFTGDMIDADEAYRLGIVNRVFLCTELLTQVFRLAEKIASRGKIAVAKSKEAIELGFDLPLEEGLEVERKAFGDSFGSPEQEEGMQAFLEKREPRFPHLTYSG